MVDPQVPITFQQVSPWLAAIQTALVGGYRLVPLGLGRQPPTGQAGVGYYALIGDQNLGVYTITLEALGKHMLACGLGGQLSTRLAVNGYLSRLPAALLSLPYQPSTRWELLGILP